MTRPIEGPDDRRHGSTVGYQAGCREDCCRRAKMRHQKQLRIDQAAGIERIIDATGTVRRIQALMRIGWSGRYIAREAGWTTPGAVHQLTYRTTLNRASAAAIRAAYDKLSMTPGPSVKAQNHAVKMGWPPPLAWDDDLIDDPTHEPCIGKARPFKHEVDPMVVERIVAGEYDLSATVGERRAVVAEFQRRGMSLAPLERAGWKPGRYAVRSAA